MPDPLSIKNMNTSLLYKKKGGSYSYSERGSISSFKAMTRTESLAIYGLFVEEPETLPGLGGIIEGSSLSAATSAMINTMIGIGTLAIPLAYAYNGLIQGMVMTIICALLSSFSLFLLSSIAVKFGDDVSFYAVTAIAMPSLKWVVDGAIVIKSLGVATSYLMVVGDLLYSLSFSSFPHGIDPKIIRAILLLTAVIFFIAPASFPHQLKSMKYTNWISVGCILYVVLLVAVKFVLCALGYPLISIDKPAYFSNNIDWFSTYSLIKSLQTFPILIFAFACQQNIFTVSNELHYRTLPRLSLIIFISITVGILVYFIIGISGYLLFGRLITKANMLELFVENSIELLIGRFFIAVSMLFSFPIQCHPCRRSLSILLYSGVKEMEPNTEKRILDLITIVILFITTSCAIFSTNLGLAYELIGTVCSNTTAFIIPPILYIKIFEEDGLTITNFLAYGLLIIGFLILILCLGAICLNLLV
ncbi:transmembrane amino acid transporter protein [Cryptosporidium andersoni]|uniref:Transmembrane amino acid transporter protein n=1 Tax=Cryptosporidium andersoni TaxID=117008 RepID=A0A1J4MP95_9CRYT|nr:transmembrane amino acid transporter protein [Cryptosporidium andersoni]